jgi:excisionase family DNA binding protein
MPEHRLLRVAEVVRRTGLGERTVRRLVANHRLPSIRPPGVRVVLIPEDALGHLLRRRRGRVAPRRIRRFARLISRGH